MTCQILPEREREREKEREREREREREGGREGGREGERDQPTNYLLLSYHNKSREYGASDRLHLLELILSVRLDSGLRLQGLYMSTSLIWK